MGEVDGYQGLTGAQVDMQEVEVLRGICHAFGSISDVAEVVPETTRWVREALASHDVGVRVCRRRGGRLEVVGSEGMSSLKIADGGTFTKRRRSVLASKRSVIVPLQDHTDVSLALFPLMSRGVAVGVIEIAGSRERLTARWHTLEAVVSQVAILIRNLGNQNRLREEVTLLEGSVDLVQELLQASTVDDATRLTVALLHERFGVSAAVWLFSNDEKVFELRAMKGIRGEAARELERLEQISSWAEMSTEHRDELTRRFREAAGSSGVESFISDKVLLLAGFDSDEQIGGINTVSGLMFDALKNVSNVKLAERRNRTLDSAIGFAAHELKAPLAATKMLIDIIKDTQSVDRLMPALERSSKELSDLWGLVETLLQWSIGKPELEVNTVPLLDLIGRAIDCAGGGGSCTIHAHVTTEFEMNGDERQLCMAFTSLLRSALKHGSPHPVEITLFTEEGKVMVRFRDRGSPIPAGSEEAIFDPFLRDQSVTTRASNGLGLFVARKIVEAHGGKIVLEPSVAGASLCVQLPVEPQPASF